MAKPGPNSRVRNWDSCKVPRSSTLRTGSKTTCSNPCSPRRLAAFALTPLLLAADAPSKEILHPVAMVIVGGLESSTLRDTLLTPVLFWLFGEKATKRLTEQAAGAPPVTVNAHEAF
jgi:hypothetical protein